MDGNTGGYIGSYVDRTLAPYEFLALNPFAACGRPYPTYSYSNMYAYITVGTGYTGTGEAFIFGATSNNYSNDPAGHMGKNYNDPLSPGIASNTGLDNLPEVEPPTVQKNSKK
jgi:hypothetical protein